jgi:hypothetical protein
MREWIFFIASGALAVILTAAAIVLKPESPVWRWLLHAGIAVFAACAVVVLIDILKPNGSRTTLVLIGAATTISFLLIVHFMWTPIAQKLLSVQGPSITGASFPFNYAAGTTINGIQFRPGFSHSEIAIQNNTDEEFADLDVYVTPDRPIIGGAAVSAINQCTFAPPGEPPQMWITGHQKGQTGDVTYNADMSKGFAIASTYRLYCDKMRPRSAITLTLATVKGQPNLKGPTPPELDPFSALRIDPLHAEVLVSFTAKGSKVGDKLVIPFTPPTKLPPTEERVAPPVASTKEPVPGAPAANTKSATAPSAARVSDAPAQERLRKAVSGSALRETRETR